MTFYINPLARSFQQEGNLTAAAFHRALLALMLGAGGTVKAGRPPKPQVERAVERTLNKLR